MNRKPVSSSMFDEVGYDALSGDLEVRFKNGDIWVYHEVPKAKYEALLGAPSLGKYFNAYIKNKYPASKQ